MGCSLGGGSKKTNKNIDVVEGPVVAKPLLGPPPGPEVALWASYCKCANR